MMKNPGQTEVYRFLKPDRTHYAWGVRGAGKTDRKTDKSPSVPVFLLLVMLAASAAAGPKSGRPAVCVGILRPVLKTMVAAVTGNLVTATPLTISFNSPDPDTTPVGGNLAATITWGMNGNGGNPWNITVNASA